MATHPLTVDPDQQAQLETIAREDYCSPEVLLRQAIDTYIADRSMSASEREDMHTQADAASLHYQQTGLHVTHDEVKSWIKRLQSGEDAPPPECHT